MMALVAAASGCEMPEPPTLVPRAPAAVVARTAHDPVVLPAGIAIALHGSQCLPSSDPDAVDAAEARLAEILALYPPRVLEVARVERFVLCARIDNTPEAIGLATPWEHAIRLDITTDQLAAVVHHEMFHMLELAPELAREDAEYAKTGLEVRPSFDIEWELANPRGFVYGPRTTRPDGFVDAYAATDAVEDRASTYEYMMAHGEELCALARRDRVVRDKVRIIRSRIAALGGGELVHARPPCLDALDALDDDDRVN